MEVILVVEDSLIVNRHITEILKSKGYQTLSALHGSEALDVLAEHSVDLILMDVMMRAKDDGLVTSRVIRSKYDTPIVFLTALTDTFTVDKALESSPYGYLIKPFDEMELLTTVHVALLKSKVERSLKTSNEMFQAMLESLDQYLILLEENKMYYVNRQLENLTGAEFTDFQGKSFNELFRMHLTNLVSFENFMDNMSDTVSMECFDLYFKELKLPGHFGDFSMRKILVKGQNMTMVVFKNITDRVNQNILQKQLRQKRLKAIIEGQEMERARVAREIHDSLGQLLNLIKLQVKLSDAQGPNLIETLDQTIEEAHRISENMMPRKILDFPIQNCIESLILQYGSNDDRITFSYSDVPDLSDQVKKMTIYRIVQEALNNAIKYSHSDNICIQMRGVDDLFLVTIEDDGVGFNEHTQQGRGIANMKMRAEAIDAQIRIESGEERGTFIMLEIPVLKRLETAL